jgi:hypothetical protein
VLGGGGGHEIRIKGRLSDPLVAAFEGVSAINQLAGKERAAANQVPVGSALKLRRRTQLTRALRRTRNRPGGYWVAAADPQAASQAVTGTHPGRASSAPCC